MSLNDSRGPIPSPQTNITPDPSIWRRLIIPDGWGPDHTDWRIPSLVDVHTDGRMIAAASYLSNNYASWGSRQYIAFSVELWFMRDAQRIGTRFDLGLALVAPPNVGKPHDISDVAKEYRHPEAVALISQATHFVVYQHLHEVSEPIGGSGDGGGGYSVPFPPITFP